MALLGLSEYTFMSFSRIREPYVRKLLNKRALIVLAVTVLVDAALVVLFVFVPGKRLWLSVAAIHSGVCNSTLGDLPVRKWVQVLRLTTDMYMVEYGCSFTALMALIILNSLLRAQRRFLISYIQFRAAFCLTEYPKFYCRPFSMHLFRALTELDDLAFWTSRECV